jgi:putative ABC transport system permease protein
MKKKNEYRHPPRLGEWIIKKIYYNKEHSTRLGDFGEIFNHIIRERSLLEGWIWYWNQALKSIFIRTIFFFYWRCIMFKHYLLIGVRAIFKNKYTTFINIFGLSLGIAVSLVILIYVNHEFSFDKFYEHSKRIYRLERWHGGNYMNSADGKVLAENLPEIQKYVRFKNWDKLLLKNEAVPPGESPRKVQVDFFALADPAVFDVFSYNFIEGNPKGALDLPFSIVITKSIAKRLFTDRSPIGRIIKVGSKREFKVTGVVDDFKKNTHMYFQTIASIKTLEKVWTRKNVLNNFHSGQFFTYLLLPKVHDKNLVEEKMNRFMKKNYPDYVGTREKIYHLRPLDEVYLYGRPNFGARTNSAAFVYTLLFVAIIIIIVGGINYINLATAQATERFKEIGIKKVVGATRKNIISQLLAESVLMCMISLMVALVLTAILLPYFNSVLDRDLSLRTLTDPFILGLILICIGALGLLSGIVPALYINSFNCMKILKGENKDRGKRINFKKGLTIVQFMISFVLIASALLIVKQTDYVKNQQMGFDKDQVLTFERSGTGIKAEPFKEELLKNPNVSKVSFSNGAPGIIEYGDALTFNNITVGMAVFSIDPDFLDLYKIKLVKGRNFDWTRKSDHVSTVILNEAAVKKFELQDPIGQVYHQETWEDTIFPTKDVTIIGVVKDFNYQSLHVPIRPMVFVWNNKHSYYISVKLASADISGAMKHVLKTWRKFTDFELEYEFIDEVFDKKYKNDQRLGRLINFSAILAIIISGLGILGLSMFAVRKKTKEIGIRKVNGAKTSQIFFMLLGNFGRNVIFAFIIAAPLAFFLLSKWLQNFAYKTSLSWWIFAAAGITTLAVATLSVCWHSWKASVKNPVDSLRYE